MHASVSDQAPARDVAVVGAGIFGVTAALALRRRGHTVSLFDPGPLPHPLAESTDISKVVRLDYGPDDVYLALMESALEGWRRWNRDLGEPLFHEVGVLFVARSPMGPGSFEHESFVRLANRGHPVERLDAAALRARFPAWSTGAYVDGYWNPRGGYAESGRVVDRLIGEAARAGVRLFEGYAFERLEERGSRVAGIVARKGHEAAAFEADRVLVAAGAWTPHALPFLAPCMRSVGQPVFHLAPADPSPYEDTRFPVFGADIARTGYYGFPANGAGVVEDRQPRRRPARPPRLGRGAHRHARRRGRPARVPPRHLPRPRRRADRAHARLRLLRYVGRALLDRARP